MFIQKSSICMEVPKMLRTMTICLITTVNTYINGEVDSLNVELKNVVVSDTFVLRPDKVHRLGSLSSNEKLKLYLNTFGEEQQKKRNDVEVKNTQISKPDPSIVESFLNKTSLEMLKLSTEPSRPITEFTNFYIQYMTNSCSGINNYLQSIKQDDEVIFHLLFQKTFDNGLY